jgi:S-DNA-T family DNA segregation ATPase FtsK/SpoIIIE
MISDQEIDKIRAFWSEQQAVPAGEQPPWEEIIAQAEENGEDELVQQAITIVRKAQRASSSMLQRRLRIGYPRAARLIDELEEMGVVGPSLGSGKDREVLLDPEAEDDEMSEDEDDESAA